LLPKTPKPREEIIKASEFEVELNSDGVGLGLGKGELVGG